MGSYENHTNMKIKIIRSSGKPEDHEHTLLLEGEKLEMSGFSSRKRPTEAAVLEISSDDDYEVERSLSRTDDTIDDDYHEVRKGSNGMIADTDGSTTDDFIRPAMKMNDSYNIVKKRRTMGRRPRRDVHMWESSSSVLEDASSDFLDKDDRFANVVVQKQHCYYRSNLKCTVKIIRRLNLTDQHLEAIKHTPFWFLVKSIMEEDEDMLLQSTTKHEDDIRLLVRNFDCENRVFRIGGTVLKLEKRDLELIFGVRDGNKEVNVRTDIKITPWMRRCFPILHFEKYTKMSMPKLKKLYIYTELQKMCDNSKDDKIHAEDVARLIHCYLLASLFIPDGDASIPWSLCEFLEEFSEICTFDWCGLVIDQLVNQLVRTKTMKVSGCAMLLPYWLCEHTGVIKPRSDGLFPRYLRWDLNELHKKLSKNGLDVITPELDIKTVLKQTLMEKFIIPKEMTEASYGTDTPTQPPNDNDNFMRTAAGDSTTKTVIPEMIESVPESNQTTLGTGLAENDNVVQLNLPKPETSRSANWSDGPPCSLEPGIKEVVRVEGDNAIQSTNKVESTKYSGFESPSCSLERGCHLSLRYKGTVLRARDDVLPSSEMVESTKCCSTHEELMVANAFLKDKHKDLEKSMKQLSDDKVVLHKTIEDLKAEKLEKSRELNEVRSKLIEKEKLLIKVQRKGDDLEHSLTTQEAINVKREQELADVREQLLKRETEIQLLTQSKNERINKLESDVSTLKVKENLLIQVQRGRDDLESSLTAEKEINMNQSRELANVREQLSKRKSEIELLTRRENKKVNELDSEISTLKDNLKSAQAKERALKKKYDDLSDRHDTFRASAHRMQDKFDAEKQKTAKFGLKVTKLTHACENPKAFVEEPGELLSKKESITCNLQREGNRRADNADKKKLGVGPSDAQYGKCKSKLTPDVYSPAGSVARAVNKRTRDDASKEKPVTPDSGKVIYHSDEEVLPMKKESKRSSYESYNTGDQVIKYLQNITPGSVIWSGKEPFAKVTVDDVEKVLLENESLTGGIIDSWGELLIQHLKKKRIMTSTFIFTSRILEDLVRHGEPSTIQEIVDSQIRRAANSQILILPVLDYANGCWTLLQYDVSCSTWTIFNTMQPRSAGAISHFRPSSLTQLVEYMEKRMSALIDLKKNIVPLATPNKNGDNVRPLQHRIRPERSLDSGVIVCHIMETILKGDPTSTIKTTAKGMYRKSTAYNYRFRMVKSFCFPDQME